MKPTSMKLDANGHELPDPTPVQIPAGFKRPETLAEQVQRLVRHSVSAWAANNQEETFEEADDFDTGDEDNEDMASPYETFFDPVLGRDLSPAEFKANEVRYRADYLKAQHAYYQHLDRVEAVTRRSETRGAGGQPPASTPPVQPSSGEKKPA